MTLNGQSVPVNWRQIKATKTRLPAGVAGLNIAIYLGSNHLVSALAFRLVQR